MRVRELEGGGTGAAVGEGGVGVLPGEAAPLHGAQDGGVPGRAAQDIDGEDSEVRAPGHGQEVGLFFLFFSGAGDGASALQTGESDVRGTSRGTSWLSRAVVVDGGGGDTNRWHFLSIREYC